MENKIEKIDFEAVSFQIISKVAESKQIAFESLGLAKVKDFKTAKEKMKEAEAVIGKAGEAHMDVIVQEAQGVQHPFKVLFMHAEDQFLTTQTMLLIISELIEVYERLDK